MAERASSDIAGLIPHRACRNCVQIKVKCMPRRNDSGELQNICQRCHRLGKACTTPAPVTRRKGQGTSSKVAQLEERINQMSTLLTPISSPRNAVVPSNSDSGTAAFEQERVLESSTPKSNNREVLTAQLGQASFDDDTPILTCSSRVSGQQSSKIDANGRHDSLSAIIAPPHLVAKGDVAVSPAEIHPMYLDSSLEKRLFSDFLEKFSPFFPFVIIPISTQTQAFKRERPFVFWSAIAVASVTYRDLHYTLHERLLYCIGEQVLPKAHKSLDLLQGILILINWYHYYAPINPQMANLLHLSQALMVDLGLNRPLNHRHVTRVATDISDVYHGRQVAIGTGSSDAKRALLGTFCTISRMALCFERLEPMAFTKHMDSCCRDLEKDNEHSSDAWLVQMTRLHQIVARYLGANLTDPEMPPRFLKTGINRDLGRFLANLPSDFSNKREILMEVEGCRLCLLGPCHLGNHGIHPDSAESLHASLIAIKDFTTMTMACSPQDFITLPLWYFFTYIIGALAELSFLNSDNWDLSFVRQEYGFTAIVQQYVNKMEECRGYANEISSSYLSWRFDMYAIKTRRCIKWYEARMNLEVRTMNSNDTTTADSTEAYEFSADIFNEFNDSLWDDIMGDWTMPSLMSERQPG